LKVPQSAPFPAFSLFCTLKFFLYMQIRFSLGCPAAKPVRTRVLGFYALGGFGWGYPPN
jgi:hypothetical protein